MLGVRFILSFIGTLPFSESKFLIDEGHTHKHTYTHAHTHIYIGTYMHMCIHMHIYMHTYTNKI